jgi:hypothetical protein
MWLQNDEEKSLQNCGEERKCQKIAPNGKSPFNASPRSGDGKRSTSTTNNNERKMICRTTR